MTTVVGNKILKNVGQTEATLLSTDANTRFTVIGLSFTNVSDSVVFVDAFLDTGYYMKDVMLPVGSSLRAISAGEKLTMGFNSNFTVSASSNDAIDVIASFASIIETGLPEEVQLIESTGIAILRSGNYISAGKSCCLCQKLECSCFAKADPLASLFGFHCNHSPRWVSRSCP